MVVTETVDAVVVERVVLELLLLLVVVVSSVVLLVELVVLVLGAGCPGHGALCVRAGPVPTVPPVMTSL